MGKTALILAPLIVGVAMLWVMFWMGQLFERAKHRVAAGHIDVGLYAQLVDFVRGLVSPKDLADPPYLPPDVRQEALKLSARAHENVRRVEQARLRRRGL